MSKRDTLLLLDDMLQSAQKIKQYTAGLNYDSFIADNKTVDAVVRNFEIIGEAANRIDEDFRSSNPEIEWKRIEGFATELCMIILGLITLLFGISSRRT